MNKDINKFKNSKGKITNKLANDIYETQMDKDMTTKEKKEKYDMLGIGASLVHIYFKDLGIIRYTREESYSVVDLIGEHYIYFIVLTTKMNVYILSIVKCENTLFIFSCIWRNCWTMHGIQFAQWV